MAAPFARRDVAEMLGSWPLSVVPGFTNPTLLPNSLLTQATILGIKRAPAGGFAVGGKSMYIWRDVAGVPTQHQVLFPGGGPYTLQQVIDFINNTAGIFPAIVAFNNNGFLMLKSPTVGEASYLRLQTSLSPEVFNILGLFSETVSRGGDVRQAQHIDPTRQIALPGQVAMQLGETFSTDVFNRLGLQLGINVDRDSGLLEERRIGVRQEESIVFGGGNIQLNTGNPNQGVFTGKTTLPTFDQLRDTIVVLNANGDEFTKDVEETLGGPAVDFTAAIQQTPWPNPVDNGRQRILSPTVAFTSNDVKDPIYVVLTGIAVGFGDELNGKPLKVIEFVNANEVIVQNTNPATGALVNLTASSGTMSGRRVRMHTVRAEVEGLFQDAGLTVRVENQQLALTGSLAVTRVEKSNRVVAAGATFTVSAKVGDLVVWTAFGSTEPFTNNGTYKIKKIVDDETLELAASDNGPVYLNSNSGLGLGNIIIRSDGNFWRTPYVKLAQPTGANLAAGRGALPGTGETIRFAYLAQSTVRESTDDVAKFAGTVRHTGDATGRLQRALMRIVGPSVTSFEEVLYGENWTSLEKLEFRADKEHHEHGRHSTVRPDVLDMYPGTNGPTVTLRTNFVTEIFNNPKLRLIDQFDNKVKLGINPLGHIGLSEDLTSFPLWPAIDPSGFFRADIFVDRTTTRAGALLKGTNARLAIQGSTASFPSVNTDDEGVAAVRYYFTDGVMVQPHIFNTSLKSRAVATEAFLSLGDVENNGAGLSFINNLIVGTNGNVGVGFSTDVLSNPATYVPAAPLHVSARSGSITELLRLEGRPFGTTVAMTWKPDRLQPFFAFAEVDEDANDWFLNFVTTATMDTESTGTELESTMRWVLGATREGMRLNKKGLELGRDMRDTAANAIAPRLRMKLADSIVGPTALSYVEPFDQLGKGGLFFSALDEGDFSWIIGGKIDATGQYLRDGASTTQLTTEILFKRVNLADSTIQFRSRKGDLASPWTNGDWQTNAELLLQYQYGTFPFVNGPNQLRLRNGVVELFSPSFGVGGSNMNADDFPVNNGLYAKSLIKAWARIEIVNGVESVIDGFNVITAVPLSAGSARFLIRTSIPFTNVMNATCICFVNSPGLINANDAVYAGTIGSIYGVPDNFNGFHDSFILHYTTNTGGSAANSAVIWDGASTSVVFTVVILGAQS